MAGKKISQLTLLPTLDGTELLPLVKGGENYSGVTEAISKLLLSLDNKFTGDNSFVGGKFAVTGSESEVYVSAVGSLVSRSTYGTTGWLRSFEFSDNDVVTARFGVKAMTTDNVPTTDFVGILVGSGTVNDSQYKFRANRLTVPDNFSILTNSSYGIVNFNRVDFPSSMVFGSSEWNTVVRSNDTDLVHFRNGNNYNIWDASNLADPVTKSGDNAFTGMNSFVGGQFSVGGFSVAGTGSFGWSESVSGAWARECYFYVGNPSTSPVIAFGGYGNASTNSINYAYIRVGEDGYANASYKFYPTKLVIPAAGWSINDGLNNAFELTENSTVVGRLSTPLYLKGNNTDLFHSKNLANYKIWDASNLPDPARTSISNVFTMGQTINSQNNVPLLLNYSASGATEILVRLQLEGSTKGALGNSVTNGTFLYDYTTTSYLAIKADGAYYGKESSMEKIVTESTITTLTKQITNLEQRIATLEGAGS